MLNYNLLYNPVRYYIELLALQYDLMSSNQDDMYDLCFIVCLVISDVDFQVKFIYFETNKRFIQFLFPVGVGFEYVRKLEKLEIS